MEEEGKGKKERKGEGEEEKEEKGGRKGVWIKKEGGKRKGSKKDCIKEG
ncbi:hypothetical protein NXW09_27885 [Bacteroides ovatus]|nr:hypothetical protein [Bacteroides ovatus]